MAGGGHRRTQPATSPSSSRREKAWVPRGPGPERSSECQKEGSRPSSPLISSQRTPQQTVTPVQPPKSADSPLHTVAPVQPPKSVVSPPQMVTTVLPPKFPDAPVQLGALFQPLKSVDLRSIPCGSGGQKPQTPPFWRQKAQAPRAQGDQRLTGCQKEGPCLSSPSSSSQNSLLHMVTPVEAPKSLDSMSTLCGSGSVGSDSGAAPFDICMDNKSCSFKLKPSLLQSNREKRRANSAALQRLRPGMVLLKNFLKPDDQVKIIQHCRRLGVGTGGFYTPGYRDGAKLNLKMMCLGKNWDPDSSSYGDKRPFDGAQPPNIPEVLTKFVSDALEASHKFLKQEGGEAVVPSDELPLMSPDICIINFYTNTGRLGLHQDKDETEGSLKKGLPVVSFSLGDTAEFLYGDERDDAKASKVDLESGDVLIFGGDSRHIFHGVSKIKPNTAPGTLTVKTNLLPGRLNLTFRQYQ